MHVINARPKASLQGSREPLEVECMMREACDASYPVLLVHVKEPVLEVQCCSSQSGARDGPCIQYNTVLYERRILIP